MKNVLVLGGTGFVGAQVCEQLQRDGWHATVPTRHITHAAGVQHLPSVTVVQADVHDPAQLARLVAGHSAVVNLVAVLHGDEATFERVHVTLPTRLAQACVAHGVQRLVHVSALGVAANAPSMYQRSKARGEAAVLASRLDIRILRPSVIFGAGDRFLNLFAQLQAVFPLMPLAGARARFQPVWVQDVACAVVAGLNARRSAPAAQPNAACAVVECAGPEVFTLAQLVNLAGRLGSHQRPIIPVPMAVGRLQARVMELLPGSPLMSRDNLDAMRVDNVASDTGTGMPGLRSLGIEPASLRAVAPTYLGARGHRSSLLGFRRGARKD